jgi:hypothetical protein
VLRSSRARAGGLRGGGSGEAMRKDYHPLPAGARSLQ